LVAGRFTRTLLYEMGSADPAVMLSAVGVLAVVAVTAGFIPSRRASRVDPMTALRCE
jgi:ABC-type antimicrobial peptide transport system permease subunit